MSSVKTSNEWWRDRHGHASVVASRGRA